MERLESHNIIKSELSRFRKVREEDLKIIMHWRMSPDITKYMCSDPVLTIEGQKRWFEKISADELLLDL